MATADDFLQQGIAAVQAGQIADGRRYLAQAIKLDPQNEQAWIWMSGVVDTDEQRIQCLQQALAINPLNEIAIKGLRALGIPTGAPEESPQMPPGEPEEVAPAAQSGLAAPDGIPLPDPTAIARAQQEVRPILEELLDLQETRHLDMSWLPPGKVRTGSREPLLRNPLVLAIGGGLVAFVLIVVLASALIGALHNRQAARQQASSSAPRPTPTITRTPPPTRTPTPEGDPLTPEPTLDPGDAPRGDLAYGVTLTPPYILTPHPSSPHLNNAITAFYEGRYEETVDLVDQAFEAGDEAIDGYYFKGMALFYLGKNDEASEIIREGLSINGNFAPLHAARGAIFLEEDQIEQARTEYQLARELDPELDLAVLGLAQIDLLEGEYEQALAVIDEARVQRNKYNTNLLVVTGEIYLAQGRENDALAVGNLAHYIDPGSPQVMSFLARTRLSMGLAESAMFGLEAFVDQVDPFNAGAWTLLARAYQMQGRTQDALDAYNRASQLAEDTTDILIGRGLLYFEQGDYDLAYTDLDTAVERRGDHVEARYGRAISAFALEEYEQALEDLAFVRQARPDDPDIEALYIRMLIENEQYDDVIPVVGDALRLDLSPEQRGYLFEARARAYYDDRDYQAALPDIDQALAQQNTGTRHYLRALILNALGSREEAIIELEWVVFWHGIFDYPFGEDAADLLETLYQERAEDLLGTDTPTPTPSPTGTPTITPTSTTTPTGTPSPTPSPTASPGPTGTDSP